MFDDLNKKIIVPFLKSSNLSDEEQKKVSLILSQLVEQSIIIEIIKVLTDDEKKDYLPKIGSVKTAEEKAGIYKQILDTHQEAQANVKKYLEEELPKFMEEVVSTFLKSATPDQKADYLKLSQTS